MKQCEEPLISVIIPVYNVERYLEQCLESVVNQTYRNLEIIIVDDASPDNSREIYLRYQKMDARIRIIRKEKNAGLSKARNSALEVCQGQFVYFLDSDDYIQPEMLEHMYQAMHRNDADMAICAHERVDECGKGVGDRPLPEIACADSRKIYELFVQEKLPVFVQTKLYRRELFEKVRFPVGKMHEDVFIFPEIMRLCRRITVLSEELFKYRVHFQSFTNSSYTLAHMDAVEGFVKMYRYMKKDGLDSYIYVKKFAYVRLIVAIKKCKFGVEERNRIKSLRRDILKYCGVHIKYTPMVFVYYWMRKAGFVFKEE